MASYAYDQEWKHERERLAGIERLWDGGSHALLERLGVSSGWRCIEVGAGAGSMVEWLSDKVGLSGSVTAVDVSTRFLEAIDKPNVQVLGAVTGFMERAGYDRFFGRRIFSELRAAGLEDVQAEARARVIQGGTAETAFYRLSLESLREPIVASGALTGTEVNEALRRSTTRRRPTSAR